MEAWPNCWPKVGRVKQIVGRSGREFVASGADCPIWMSPPGEGGGKQSFGLMVLQTDEAIVG